MSDALVLAGGGVAGIAWEVGVLRGIQEVDPALAEIILAASLLGTSAGSAVAAQVASGVSLEELYAVQIAEESAELGADLDVVEFGAMIARTVEGAASPEEARRRIGVVARSATTVAPEVRRAVIEARLESLNWPDRELRITAVDVDSGELRVFDRASGVSLVDAIGASCAVPGVWPTVEIQGRHYMDGGVRSGTNADLAAGADRVLIIVPAPEVGPNGSTIPQAELDALAPASIQIIYADAESLAAFGPNPLDPETRPAAAEAGRQVGRASVPALRAAFPD